MPPTPSSTPPTTPPTTHIAIDLGAESGRIMLGTADAGRIALQEIHRWPSRRVQVLGSQRWDLLYMWGEMLEGLKKAAATGQAVRSVSVNSWAVDYVLLKGGHPSLTPPFMYRDERVDHPFETVMADEALQREIFDESGIQFLPFNTAYQLQADDASLLAIADGMLLIADYFNHLLGGGVSALQERSNASSTQLYNPNTRTWSRRLADLLGLPAALLPELCDAGEILGTISPEVAELTGLSEDVQVVATCSHDTGNAVAGTPLSEERGGGGGGAYLSSGTWSLLGVEVAEPIITEAARRHNFTNEVGYGHSIRLLKNLSGLFLVQECRREWGEDVDYGKLAAMAEEAQPLRSLIRPERPEFARPGKMAEKIADFCRSSGQPVPEGPGQVVRCIYDSLALLYAQTLDQLEEVTGTRPAMLHIVGGGSQADLLNQLAADACGVPVEAGPAEATALGNLGIQAIIAGTYPDLAAVRQAIRGSVEIRSYAPKDDRYPAAKARFAALAES